MAYYKFVKESFFGLLRVQRTPVTIIPALAGFIMAGGSDINRMLLLAFTIFFFHISAGAINNIADYETDKINAPDRPLVKGTISMRQAWLLGVLCAIVALFSAWFLNPMLFLLAVTFGVIFEITYNFGPSLKGNPIGSFIYLTSARSFIPFLVGALATENLSLSIVLLCLFLFVLSASAFVSALKDIEGDRLTGKRTLAVALGLQRSQKLATFLLLFPVLLYIIPPCLLGFSYMYLVFCIAPGTLRVFMAYLTIKKYNRKNAERLGALARVLVVIDVAILVPARPKTVFV